MTVKYARPLTTSLRLAIAAGSAAAFFGGWALLAHSANPYDNNAAAQGADVPAASSGNVAPLPAMPTPRAQGTTRQRVQPNTAPQLNPGSQLSPFTPNFQTGRVPRLRTGGS